MGYCVYGQGLRGSLEATMHVKGLLEMMFDVLSGWIDEFIFDMEARLKPLPQSSSSMPAPCLCVTVLEGIRLEQYLQGLLEIHLQRSKQGYVACTLACHTRVMQGNSWQVSLTPG